MSVWVVVVAALVAVGLLALVSYLWTRGRVPTSVMVEDFPLVCKGDSIRIKGEVFRVVNRRGSILDLERHVRD